MEVGEDAKEVRVRPQSGNNDIQGSDTCGTTIWLGDLGPILGNDEDGGGDIHRFSEKNHREAGAVEGG